MINDNTVLAAQEALVSTAIEYKLPLITADTSGVEKGGLANVGTSYKMVGVHTAKMCIEYINGKMIHDMPVVVVQDSLLYINIETANIIGLELSDDLLNKAYKLYGGNE